MGTARADNPDTLQREADQLRAQNADLDQGAAQALLELYALESSLQRAKQRRASLEGRITELEEQQASARHSLDVARTSEASAQEALAERVRAIYVEGKPEPLEVVLGASSLDELINAIDSVNRLADHDQQIITQVQDARRDLRVALRELAERQEELTTLAGAAEAALTRIERARDEKAKVSELAQATGGAQRPPDRIADRAGAGRRGGGVRDRLGGPRCPRGDGRERAGAVRTRAHLY